MVILREEKAMKAHRGCYYLFIFSGLTIFIVTHFSDQPHYDTKNDIVNHLHGY